MENQSDNNPANTQIQGNNGTPSQVNQSGNGNVHTNAVINGSGNNHSSTRIIINQGNKLNGENVVSSDQQAAMDAANKDKKNPEK